MLSDRAGIPLVAGISAANRHDMCLLAPLVRGIPAIASRRGPRRRRPDKLHADKAYDSAQARTFLRERGIKPRIARRGIESSDKLGRHRWVIERTMSWIGRYRRLIRRYERLADSFAAFVSLACALISYKHLPK